MNNLKILAPLLLLFLALACKDDSQLRIAEVQRAEKYNDSILKRIDSHWHFDVPAPTPEVAARIEGWNEWRQFRAELAQKPVGTIGAFKQKTKNLVNKADQLRNNIPPFFNKPAVLSRIGVLVTKTKMIYTFLNLEVPQDKKIIPLIDEITAETASLQNQMDEVVRRSAIPKEEGEQEMLQALDPTRRANPDAIPQPEETADPATVNRRHAASVNQENLQKIQRLKSAQ